MAHVLRRPPSARPAQMQARVKPSVRKHKIVLENVTQEQKKLYSVISFEARPPPGYTFIPAGNPALTNQCKDMARKEGSKVLIVSTTPHKKTTTLSHQVHRIGYHFQSHIVAEACRELGLYLTRSGKIESLWDTQHESHSQVQNRRQRAVSQTTLNTEARDTIKDLFPNIPEKDLNQIISTAFQQGTKKVGTAAELPLVRRAQLAVVAHIRHIYTNYDRLLRIGSYLDARAEVEQKCLDILVGWRGADENGTKVLEDVFREVIVISDDEDSEDDEENELFRRDASVEIISSNAFAHEAQTRPIKFDQGGSIGLAEAHYLSEEEEAPPGYRIVPAGTQRRKDADKKKVDRRGFIRYRAWDQALDRYRQAPDRERFVDPKPYVQPVEHAPHYLQQSILVEREQIRPEPQYFPPPQPVMKAANAPVFFPIPSTETRRIDTLDSYHVQRPVLHRDVAPSDVPPHPRYDDASRLVRLSNGNTILSHEQEHEIVQLQPIYGSPKYRFPEEQSAYPPEKVRNRVTNPDRLLVGSRRQGSADIATIPRNTIMPSIEDHRQDELPRTAPQPPQHIHRGISPPAVSGHFHRPSPPNTELRRVARPVRGDLHAELEAGEMHQSKKRRMDTNPFSQDPYDDRQYPGYQGERTVVRPAARHPFEGVQSLSLQSPTFGHGLEKKDYISRNDYHSTAKPQTDPTPSHLKHDATRLALRATYESNSFSSAPGHLQGAPSGPRSLVAQSTPIHGSHDFHFKPSSYLSRVDDPSPFIKKGEVVRSEQFREVIRPRSNGIPRDRDGRMIAMSGRLQRDQDRIPGEGRRILLDQKLPTSHPVRYIPVPHPEIDRVYIAQDSPFVRDQYSDGMSVQQGPGTELTVPASLGREPFNVISYSTSQPNLRRSLSPHQHPVLSSFRPRLIESPSAFPVTRRIYRQEEYAALEQPSQAMRPEGEIRRDLAPGSRLVRFPRDNDGYSREVGLDGRSMPPLTMENFHHRQPVHARGEVIMLE